MFSTLFSTMFCKCSFFDEIQGILPCVSHIRLLKFELTFDAKSSTASVDLECMETFLKWHSIGILELFQH